MNFGDQINIDYIQNTFLQRAQRRVSYKTVKIDPLTGLLATDYTPNPVLQRFIPGTEPKRYAPIPDVAEIKTRDEHKQKNGFFSIKNRKISEEDEKIKMIKKQLYDWVA